MFQTLEGIITFFGPLEPFPLLEQLKEQLTSIS